MKTKSIIPLLSMLALFAANAVAQDFREQLENNPEMTIKFITTESDIVIEGHDGNEIVIRNLDYEPPPERARGLRALYNTAEDNTGIGLSVEREGNTLSIIQATNESGDFRLTVPNRVRLMVEEVNWGGGDIKISNHNGEIEVKSRNGDILLDKITGPVIASSTSGDFEANFSSLDQETPTSISLVSGYIDITIPADTPADFHLASVSGEIYTDLGIEVSGNDNGNMRIIGGGRKISGTLNGGGVEVGLKSVSGNIYLRKREQ